MRGIKATNVPNDESIKNLSACLTRIEERCVKAYIDGDRKKLARLNRAAARVASKMFLVTLRTKNQVVQQIRDEHRTQLNDLI